MDRWLAMRQSQITLHSRIISTPCCEFCDAPMGLVSIEPHKPDHDRRTFECPRCRYAIVEMVKKATARFVAARESYAST